MDLSRNKAEDSEPSGYIGSEKFLDQPVSRGGLCSTKRAITHSGNKHQPPLRNIPEERNPQLHAEATNLAHRTSHGDSVRVM
jgi:hypothetical protein